MGRVRLGVCAEVLDALKQVLLDGAFVFDVEVYTSEGVTDTNAVAVCLNDVGVSFGELIILAVN